MFGTFEYISNAFLMQFHALMIKFSCTLHSKSIFSSLVFPILGQNIPSTFPLQMEILSNKLPETTLKQQVILGVYCVKMYVCVCVVWYAKGKLD